MGYVNLSIYVWKTSKKVSGQKNSMAQSRTRRSSKSKKFSDLIIWIFFTSRFKFGTKMRSLPPKWTCTTPPIPFPFKVCVSNCSYLSAWFHYWIPHKYYFFMTFPWHTSKWEGGQKILFWDTPQVHPRNRFCPPPKKNVQNSNRLKN